LYQNPPSIPVSYPVKRLIAAWYGQILCWDQVIQRTYCSVTGYPFFGVWMDFIIQDLIFESDSRSGSFVEIGVYKILDSGVGTFRQFKFKSEFEIGKFILCNYIATIGRFGPTARQHTQFTVFDRPAPLSTMVQLGTDPSFIGLTIPEQPPSSSFVLVAQRVGDEVEFDHGGIHLPSVLVQVCRSDPDIAPT